MEAMITLKKSFLKRRISADAEMPAEVKLTNGKEYSLCFILEKSIIEVGPKNHHINNEKITTEERIAIIEALLTNYTLFLKSIVNFTTSYCFEYFRLADTTFVCGNNYDVENYTSKDNILEEYLKSDYAKISINKVFRALYDVYIYLIKNSKVLKDKGALIKINYQLNVVQRMDLKYFTSAIINSLKLGSFDIEILKEDSKIKITPKQSDSEELD